MFGSNEPFDLIDFSVFNNIYDFFYSKTKRWIHFKPKNASLVSGIRENNGGTHLGYKVHVAIPKDDHYGTHLKEVIKILSLYEFSFKIDALLTQEKCGERAFTVYLPHQYHARWFEALKLVDDYLKNQLTNHKKPKKYSSDYTAKMVTGFNYIRYRNDRGPGGNYTRNPFDNLCELSLINPFRPDLVSLLRKIYRHDKQLYQTMADQMKNNITYCEFLIHLCQNNPSDFLNLFEVIASNQELYKMISSLSWYRKNNFVIAEQLVKNPSQFKTISEKLLSKSDCPGYHESIRICNEYTNSHPHNALTRETNDIGHAIQAITVRALYATLIEKKSHNQYRDKAQQQILKEIDSRLVHNDRLTVYKSQAKCIGATLKNIFHAIPMIGWGIGAYKYWSTGSFWYSYKKKLKPQKKVESQLINAVSSNKIFKLPELVQSAEAPRRKKRLSG